MLVWQAQVLGSNPELPIKKQNKTVIFLSEEMQLSLRRDLHHEIRDA
jgi:hypothetical protein